MKMRKLIVTLCLLNVPVGALAQETQPTETVMLRSVMHRYRDPRACDNPILVTTYSRSGASTKDELTEVCHADLNVPPEWEIRVARIIGNPLGPDVMVEAIVRADEKSRPMFNCKALNERCWVHLKMTVREMTAGAFVRFPIRHFNAATRHKESRLLADEANHTIIPAWCRDVVFEDVWPYTVVGTPESQYYHVCVRDLQLPPKWLLTVSYDQRRADSLGNWIAILHPPKGEAVLLDTVTLKEDGFTPEVWRWITLQAQRHFPTRHVTHLPAEATIKRE